MIKISELLTADALRRYDDTGEPAYTSFERVLIALRWLDWATCDRILEALDCGEDDLDQERYRRALRYHWKTGRVERRPIANAWPALFEYRLLPPSQWRGGAICKRCASPAKPGHALCDSHLEWQRANKRARRAA